MTKYNVIQPLITTLEKKLGEGLWQEALIILGNLITQVSAELNSDRVVFDEFVVSIKNTKEYWGTIPPWNWIIRRKILAKIHEGEGLIRKSPFSQK